MISEEKKEEFARLLMEEYDLRPSEACDYMNRFFRWIEEKGVTDNTDNIMIPSQTVVLSNCESMFRDLDEELSKFKSIYFVEPKIYCGADFIQRCQQILAVTPWYEDCSDINISDGIMGTFEGYDVEVCDWVKNGTVVLKG